ncbi:6259_t:CDS:1 [Ambispora gerdemannii]|uniref:ADP-ribose 1''-phosphate phosphatase n=1 Tax=Ambispora gerdemannii TaxID=144530 RepID=A0A9N9BZI4_9GLOM|nr:6259_t:CDS:1 [Ambispora gerdemannii]
MESSDTFNFTEIQGDLFTDHPPGDSLAHCISEDLRMGKGIADIFKKKFRGLQELKEQNKKVGQVAYLERDGRYIFYIITKEKYFHKPSKANFERALNDLRVVCEEMGVKNLSIPRIGTGLDKLPLEYVHNVIDATFQGSDMRILMYYL